jgi:hypothetical protein
MRNKARHVHSGIEAKLSTRIPSAGIRTYVNVCMTSEVCVVRMNARERRRAATQS